MTKILNFPQKTDSNFPTTDEEADEQLKEVRTRYFEEITSDVMDVVSTVLMNYGIYVKPVGSSVKDFVFLEETLKSILYRTKSMEHPFHPMIERAIVLPEETEERLQEIVKENALT